MSSARQSELESLLANKNRSFQHVSSDYASAAVRIPSSRYSDCCNSSSAISEVPEPSYRLAHVQPRSERNTLFASETNHGSKCEQAETCVANSLSRRSHWSGRRWSWRIDRSDADRRQRRDVRTGGESRPRTGGVNRKRNLE